MAAAVQDVASVKRKLYRGGVAAVDLNRSHTVHLSVGLLWPRKGSTMKTNTRVCFFVAVFLFSRSLHLMSSAQTSKTPLIRAIPPER